MHFISAVFFQGLAFLRKDLCNVREVEFAKLVRVTYSTMEQVSFTVPRVKVSENIRYDLLAY